MHSIQNNQGLPRTVEVLKKRSNVVEVVYYTDEGHGLDKLEHQIDAARRIVGWFEKYLKGAPAHPLGTDYS